MTKVKDVRAQLDRLLPLLYVAPGDGQGWSAFVEQLTREVGAVQGLFVHHDAGNKNTDLSFGFNLDPDWAHAYADYYQYLNPYLALPPSANRTHGSVALLSELIDDSAVEASEFFSDYVVPQGVTVRNAIRLIVNENQGQFTAIALHRSLANSAADMTDALVLCGLLMPHLRAALKLHGRLTSLQSRVALLEGALDRLPFGLLILSSRLEILTLNARAEEILAREDGLSLRNDRLRTLVSAETTALYRQMRAAAGLGSEEIGRIGGHLRIHRRGGGLPYEMHVFPLFEQDPLSNSPDRGVACLLTDPERDADTPLGLLRHRYGLTLAEERIALLLLEGRDVNGIADRLQVSNETVRSQLKAIFRKTETRRQGELIARILQGDALMAARMAGVDWESGE